MYIRIKQPDVLHNYWHKQEIIREGGEGGREGREVGGERREGGREGTRTVVRVVIEATQQRRQRDIVET